MDLLMTIRDADIGSDAPVPPAYRERISARAVVSDRAGAVALLYVSKRRFHKLPGGGVEDGESVREALVRELDEEIGCAVANLRELGVIEEYWNRVGLHGTSHCFLADLAGEKGQPHFDEKEIAEGFEPAWVGLGEALKILEGELDVDDYKGRFICRRELAFLGRTQEQLRRR